MNYIIKISRNTSIDILQPYKSKACLWGSHTYGAQAINSICILFNMGNDKEI